MTWWSNRSLLEKILIVTSSLAVAACTVLAILLGAGALSSITRNICLTPGCVKTAALYLQNANLSVDPCEDFFEFVCGNFEKNAVIPDTELQTSGIFTSQETVNNRLRGLLEEESQPQENKAFIKAKEFYATCMNQTEINLLRDQPLKDIIAKFGGWPVVEGSNWTPDTFDLMKMVKKARSLGLPTNIFFDVVVNVDKMNNSRYIITVNPAANNLHSIRVLLKGINDREVITYLYVMVQTAVLLGAEETQAWIELEQALLFEIQMYNFTMSAEQQWVFNKYMTLKELEVLAPQIKWVDYTNSLLVDKVEKNEEVLVTTPDYIVYINQLIADTDNRILANYFIWLVARKVLDMMDNRYMNIWLKYQLVLGDRLLDSLRWIPCLSKTTSYFRHAVGSMYIRRYLDEEISKTATNMVSDIRQELITMLKNAKWMDDITNKRAIRKAEEMAEIIAYPLDFLNDTFIEQFYTNFTVIPNAYFHSVLNIEREMADDMYRKLRETSNRKDWRNIPSTASFVDVNAFYSRLQNMIMFPAGVMHWVAFAKGCPKYVNYAVIGYIVGHEMTHGFDSEGRLYDEIGNRKEWWQPESAQQLLKKEVCMIQQYSNFNMTEINMTVNGRLTLRENIADNGGVKQAYNAYERWTQENGNELPLPGLNFTTIQLFWMSFANLYCSKTRPEKMISDIQNDDHSPARARVNGVVSNSQEFSKDFNCPSGKPMNPENKCVVW